MKKFTLRSLLCLFILATSSIAWAGVLPENYRIEPIMTNLTDPSAMALAPDGRIFYLERTTGNVRIIENGKLLADPFVTVSVSTVGEEGLLGIAIYPDIDFPAESFFDVCLYYTQLSPRTNRIVKYIADGNVGTNETVILDNIGYGTNGLNNGGGLVIGNDGMLYATIGDMESPSEAQSDSSIKGKVLQIDLETVGFPYTKYTKGFRNSADISVNKDLGTLYVTDNYDSDDTCDETNVISSGGNCGWDTESCNGSVYIPPLQAIDPQITATSLASYTMAEYPAPQVCSNDPNEACRHGRVCSNDPDQPCTLSKHCDGDPLEWCEHDKICAVLGNPCDSDLDCVFPSINPCVWFCGTDISCVETCGSGATCEEVCGGAGCVDATTDPLFVGGEGNGTILQSILSGASYDSLQASSRFYLPNGDCPVAVKDLEVGKDGLLYVLSDDPDTSKAGIYRIIYDENAGDDAEPREVSSSPYIQMTVAKDGSGLRLWWEDLKRDVWACSDEDGDGTCDVPGEATEKYTIWSGDLSTLPTYSHTILEETDGDGTAHTDALLSYGIASMPPDDVYFLVSGRAANLEGTTGYQSDEITERPGHTETEICNVIGWGNEYHECAPDWPDPVLPSGHECSPDEPGFPDQYNKCHLLSEWRGKVILMDFAQFG